MAYKTKTQKKNALKRIKATAFRLFVIEAMTMKECNDITKIVNAAERRMK